MCSPIGGGMMPQQQIGTATTPPAMKATAAEPPTSTKVAGESGGGSQAAKGFANLGSMFEGIQTAIKQLLEAIGSLGGMSGGGTTKPGGHGPTGHGPSGKGGGCDGGGPQGPLQRPDGGLPLQDNLTGVFPVSLRKP